MRTVHDSYGEPISWPGPRSGFAALLTLKHGTAMRWSWALSDRAPFLIALLAWSVYHNGSDSFPPQRASGGALLADSPVVSAQDPRL